MADPERQTLEADADPNLACLLRDLTKANEAGFLKCLVAIAFDEEGARTAIIGHTDQDRILGAIERVKWVLLREGESEPADKPTLIH